MTLAHSAFAAGTPLPAWYGKLPGMGDFAHRRMPEHFLSTWDAWLQGGLHGLRSRDPAWVDHYLQGPLWCFALGAGIAGLRPWVGVMMPSVDSAGRYFPLTLAAELVRGTAELEGGAAAACRQFWALSAEAAMQGLDQDMDAARFDGMLQERFGAAAWAPPQASQDVLRLPQGRQTAWFQSPHQVQRGDFEQAGLPQGVAFDALFRSAQECAAPVAEVSP